MIQYLFSIRSSAQVLESSTNLEVGKLKIRIVIARGPSYSDYGKFRNFPLLN